MPSPYFGPPVTDLLSTPQGQVPAASVSPYAYTPQMIASAPAAVEAIGDQILQGPGGSQSYDRFKSVYQARTGDVTADPFLGLGDRNAARIYNQNVASRWSNNQALLRAFGMPSDGSAAVATAPGAASVPAVGPDANETAYYLRNPEHMYDRVLANPAVAEVTKSLGVPQMSPDVAAGVLGRTGMMPEKKGYVSSVDDNPESPNYGLDAKVLNDPKFNQLMRLNPQLASQTYEALTGVSLETAHKTQLARRADREKLDDLMVSRLANDLTVDPKTGKLARLQRVRKTPGFMDKYMPGGSTPEYEDTYVPLTPIEQRWIDSGAFTRKTGISLDNLAGRTSNPPTDPATLATYKEVLQRTGNARLAELAAKRGSAQSPTSIAENPDFTKPINPLWGMLSPLQAARVAGQQIGDVVGRYF